jgi:hypothetical protein
VAWYGEQGCGGAGQADPDSFFLFLVYASECRQAASLIGEVMAVKDQAEDVQLKGLVVEGISLRLVGTSSLIVHKWSEKAKKQMLDKQMKKPSQGKEAKDPEKDYRESLYICDDGSYGFPAVGFKAAAVRAGTYSDMKMVFLRGAFHVEGDLVKISGEPQMREDMVRVGQGTADIRYRPEFPKWETELQITYNSRALTSEQIVHLFEVAGFAVGVGEWRPEKDGQFGRFRVETA